MLFGTDSHTCNAGAFGQFATGVGNTDAGFILGTGKLLIKVGAGGGEALSGRPARRATRQAWHLGLGGTLPRMHTMQPPPACSGGCGAPAGLS